MKRLTGLTMVVLVLCVTLGLIGCGDSGDSGKPAPGGKVDTTTPIAELKAAAASMDVEQLKTIATKYQKAIVAKKADIEKVTAKLQEIPKLELLGEEAKTLKAEIDEITSSLSTLKERFQVYLDKLIELKADVSAFTI